MTKASGWILCVAMAIGCGSDGGGGDPGPDAAIDPTPKTAVPGQRCAAGERVGLIVVTDGRIRAEMFDRTDPQLGDPALADASCEFHQYRPSAPCDGCGDGQLCDLDGQCVAAPRRDTGGQLTLRSGGQEQVFEADAELGSLGGDITLSGTGFTLEVVAFGQTVTLDSELAVPPLLEGFTGSLVGSYDAPERVEARWTPAGDDSHLFTNIPINHHASGAFTECAIAASTGALDVQQPMLEPLAVITGLEFQTFEHVRFAAAETARGCVEIRFSQRQSIGLDGL